MPDRPLLYASATIDDAERAAFQQWLQTITESEYHPLLMKYEQIMLNETPARSYDPELLEAISQRIVALEKQADPLEKQPINDYDKWAIRWGYSLHPEYKTPEDEHKGLVPVVTDSLSRNHRLWFGGESDPWDSRCQSEDLGDNAVTASAYGIKNLKRIYPELIHWTAEPTEGYEGLMDYTSAVYQQ